MWSPECSDDIDVWFMIWHSAALAHVAWVWQPPLSWKSTHPGYVLDIDIGYFHVGTRVGVDVLASSAEPGSKERRGEERKYFEVEF